MRDKYTHIPLCTDANPWQLVVESQARTRTELLPVTLALALAWVVVTLAGKENCLDGTLGSKMKLDSGRYAGTVINLGSSGQGVPRS